MHNPLALFDTKVLNALQKAGHGYFVRQTYKRGIDHTDTELKGAYLITQYREQAKAQIHYDALGHDPARCIYDVSVVEQLEKLKTAATQPKGYRIYSALLKDKKWGPPPGMKEQIKGYISRKLNWQPKGSDTVNSDLFFQFGELFITLKWGSHEAKVPLTDIERL